MPVPAPAKPFPRYKWRWATYAPTESLNDPPVYLGILRILNDHEHEPPNSPSLFRDLSQAEAELRRTVGLSLKVSLARDPKRNLLRNSQQYWKALGLLDTTSGGITLTDFGRRVAGGGVTQDEFAATTIKTLELPNRNIERDTLDWDNAGLSIRPLSLLLDILSQLYVRNGPGNAYLTLPELVKIVIPLAGVKASIDTHVRAITEFRDGTLDIRGWPDCAPEANDKRMAREFLLFLANYGYCKLQPGHTNDEDQYYLNPSALPAIAELSKLIIRTTDSNTVVRRIRQADALSETERRRIMAEILARPQQARFRKDVLRESASTCLLTGETMPDVLEAAHIIPVKQRGTDVVGNGLCLRSDIHSLFDSKHLRIAPDSTIVLSELAQNSAIYGALPNRVAIPGYVDTAAIEWRWKYA